MGYVRTNESLAAVGDGWHAAPIDEAASDLHAEILRGEHAFVTLRGAWTAAIARMSRPSLFATPEFLELSWRRLGRAGDEPWFVVVREAGALVGLLPLLLTRDRVAGLPVKVLRHLGMLAGDRPGLVHTVDADRVWQAALGALVECRAAWQLLDLRELDEQAWPLSAAARDGLFSRRGLRPSMQVDTYAGFLHIDGSWETYLQTRSRNTRQGYLRRERQLKEAHPDLRIEVIDDAQQIRAAFDRYLAIEAKGWKSQAAVGLWSDAREPDFNRELLHLLAQSGRASVWLLVAGEDDIAGLVRMRQGPITYERHSAFDPAYARHSPSTYLCMQAVRKLYGSDCDESDVMGMGEPMEQRPAIHSWYPGLRVTRRLQVLSPPWHFRLLLRARSCLQTLQRLRSRIDDKPAPAPPAAKSPSPPAHPEVTP